MKQYATLKRAAAVREMTELGQSPMQIAILLQCNPSLVYSAFRQFNIPWTRQTSCKDPWLTRLILRDARLQLTQAQMSERYGTSAESISVTICKLRKAGKLPPSMHSRAKPANIDQHQPASHA